jgi:RNA polymerase sigma factor (sigma-70 family)
MSALLRSPGAEQQGRPDDRITDHKLVAAVRRGDDRAFEALYERYHRRIHAYVSGMVKDHQRAEDVTQEVFVSALRRMRATERPIAFKPWIYEIAKNACIDAFRRSRRAELISYDAEEGLAAVDHGRLVSREPVPDAAFAVKQQLDDLCGAFGGLSDAHHEILVLRELEGLSYREIGERMGISRPAVESTLFRARRRLGEEYDEIASGRRCARIQSIIANATSGRQGARDTRRLARHVAHCQPCRRAALAAGVDSALVGRKPLRRRAIEKVAALFPVPLVLRGHRERGGGGGSADGWMAQLPMVSDHAAAGGAKAAAVAALVVAGLGAGVGTHVVPVGTDSSHHPAARGAKPAAAVQPAAREVTTHPRAPVRPAAASKKDRSSGRPTRARGGSGSRSTFAPRPGSGGRTGSGASSSGSAPTGGGTGVTPAAGSGGKILSIGGTPGAPSTGVAPSVPSVRVQVPAADPGSGAPTRTTIDTGPAVDQVTGAVEQTTDTVTGAVQDTTGAATDTVQSGVGGLGG